MIHILRTLIYYNHKFKTILMNILRYPQNTSNINPHIHHSAIVMIYFPANTYQYLYEYFQESSCFLNFRIYKPFSDPNISSFVNAWYNGDSSLAHWSMFLGADTYSFLLSFLWRASPGPLKVEPRIWKHRISGVFLIQLVAAF